MKFVFMFLAAMLLTVPGRCNSIPSCQTGSLASYEALALGCTVGDLVFDNFTYNDDTAVSTATTLVPASAVTITTVTGPDAGLTFSGSFGAGVGIIQDEDLEFDVTTEGGQATISDFGLQMDATFTGTGDVSIGENGNNFYHLETSSSALGTQLEDEESIAPALSSIHLKKDILAEGEVDGTATLNSFTETFSETPASTVPEPNLSALIAIGLPLLLYFKRRRRIVP